MAVQKPRTPESTRRDPAPKTSFVAEIRCTNRIMGARCRQLLVSVDASEEHHPRVRVIRGGVGYWVFQCRLCPATYRYDLATGEVVRLDKA